MVPVAPPSELKYKLPVLILFVFSVVFAINVSAVTCVPDIVVNDIGPDVLIDDALIVDTPIVDWTVNIFDVIILPVIISNDMDPVVVIVDAFSVELTVA